MEREVTGKGQRHENVVACNVKMKEEN